MLAPVLYRSLSCSSVHCWLILCLKYNLTLTDTGNTINLVQFVPGRLQSPDSGGQSL